MSNDTERQAQIQRMCAAFARTREPAMSRAASVRHASERAICFPAVLERIVVTPKAFIYAMRLGSFAGVPRMTEFVAANGAMVETVTCRGGSADGETLTLLPRLADPKDPLKKWKPEGGVIGEITLHKGSALAAFGPPPAPGTNLKGTYVKVIGFVCRVSKFGLYSTKKRTDGKEFERECGGADQNATPGGQLSFNVTAVEPWIEETNGIMPARYLRAIGPRGFSPRTSELYGPDLHVLVLRLPPAGAGADGEADASLARYLDEALADGREAEYVNSLVKAYYLPNQSDLDTGPFVMTKKDDASKRLWTCLKLSMSITDFAVEAGSHTTVYDAFARMMFAHDFVTVRTMVFGPMIAEACGIDDPAVWNQMAPAVLSPAPVMLRTTYDAKRSATFGGVRNIVEHKVLWMTMDMCRVLATVGMFTPLPAVLALLRRSTPPQPPVVKYDARARATTIDKNAFLLPGMHEWWPDGTDPAARAAAAAAPAVDAYEPFANFQKKVANGEPASAMGPPWVLVSSCAVAYGGSTAPGVDPAAAAAAVAANPDAGERRRASMSAEESMAKKALELANAGYVFSVIYPSVDEGTINVICGDDDAPASATAPIDLARQLTMSTCLAVGREGFESGRVSFCGKGAAPNVDVSREVHIPRSRASAASAIAPLVYAVRPDAALSMIATHGTKPTVAVADASVSDTVEGGSYEFAHGAAYAKTGYFADSGTKSAPAPSADAAEAAGASMPDIDLDAAAAYDACFPTDPSADQSESTAAPLVAAAPPTVTAAAAETPSARCDAPTFAVTAPASEPADAVPISSTVPPPAVASPIDLDQNASLADACDAPSPSAHHSRKRPSSSADATDGAPTFATLADPRANREPKRQRSKHE